MKRAKHKIKQKHNMTFEVTAIMGFSFAATETGKLVVYSEPLLEVIHRQPLLPVLLDPARLGLVSPEKECEPLLRVLKKAVAVYEGREEIEDDEVC